MINTQVEKNEIELATLLLEHARNRKFEWSFSGNTATAYTRNTVGSILFSAAMVLPKPNILDNDKWRSLSVSTHQGNVMSVSNPLDIIARNSGERPATPELAKIIDQLMGVALEEYREKTYGNAINYLRNL